MNAKIRPIEKRDNPALADLIRQVMPEFGASGPGFSIQDAEVDDMFGSYSEARSAYWVIELDGKVVGGGGLAPLVGGDATVCELRKMYFLRELRGRGFGQKILDLCLARAKELGFNRCYLETLTSMTKARALYEKNGFKPRTGPLGCTGHHGCDAWFERPL